MSSLLINLLFMSAKEAAKKQPNNSGKSTATGTASTATIDQVNSAEEKLAHMRHSCAHMLA
ncbi:hypothetical protein IT411_03900, partial [Candidatus Peregrinibacteria bacterium]|nr:hypothetical protein [Candidatus Peregrinibacteria bacterium]